jgi:tRNA pseudouridine38-40 synthase
MPRFALGLEFCGSRYRGWQTQQAGIMSVQQTVETALSKIANHPITLHAAGRTDAGVHACNMIAHFETDAERSIRGWIRGANTVLPHDIAVRWLQPMESDFHARFKAIARRYRYVIYNHPYRPALLNGQVTHHYAALDITKMQLAAEKLIGIHNFTSFRAVACQSNQPVRHVSHLTLTQHGQLIVLDIQANGFLHHMVRNIVGALLEIGEGLRPIEWIDHLLAVQDRKEAGITAPPDGLYFINAYYPDEFQLPNVPLGPVWLNIE